MPRTFLGPLLLAGLSFPAKPLLAAAGLHKQHALLVGQSAAAVMAVLRESSWTVTSHVCVPATVVAAASPSLPPVRLVLGLLFTLSFSCLKGSFALKFAAGLGAGSQARLRAAITLVSCCQFHLLFYSSRPLANTFATLCVNVALACWVRSSITVGSDSPANACARNGGRCVAWLAVACIVFRCDMVLLSVCVIGGECEGRPAC